ncbi:MAG: organomercurial lyase [Candidatus Aminicenantaceae bacterium]
MCNENTCAKKPVSNEQPYSNLRRSEKEVLRFILNFVLKSGKAPTPKRIGDTLKRPSKDIIRTLDELEGKDLLLRRKGTQEIVSIYPFSLEATPHQLFLEKGKRLFAMCAVDALGMPAMFKRDVRIGSRCGKCKHNITVEIRNEDIVSKSHPGIMIWRAGSQDSLPDAETCCPKINFFCSKEHVEEWKAKNPELVKSGQAVPLKLVYPEIKKHWKEYGKSIGVR